MNFKPLHDRILIKPDEEVQVSDGGIVIPDSGVQKPTQGEVLAVGNGKVEKDGTVKPPTVKVGDKVLYHKEAGTEITLEDTKVLIMTEHDILGVVV